MSKDMERLTEELEEYAIETNDFDVIVAESIAEGVLESTWLAEHDAKVRAQEREKCARIAERSAAARFLAWEIGDRIRRKGQGS